MLKLIVSKHALTTGVVILAVGLPATAQARLNLNPEPGSTSSTGITPAAAVATVPNGPATPKNPGTPAPGSTSHTPVPTAQPGFQWDDAGIGAGGALVVLAAGAGAAGVARRRRGHRPVTS